MDFPVLSIIETNGSESILLLLHIRLVLVCFSNPAPLYKYTSHRAKIDKDDGPQYAHIRF